MQLDDFMMHMLKGCIQLQSRPRIIRTFINAVPVVVAGVLSVAQVTAHPRSRMNEYPSILE